MCAGVVSGLNGAGHAPVGTVSGKLLGEGGLSAGPYPLSGRVTLKDVRGATFTTASNSKGLWELELPPGNYVATSSDQLCGPVQVSVRDGVTVRVLIVCVVL